MKLGPFINALAKLFHQKKSAGQVKVKSKHDLAAASQLQLSGDAPRVV
jgi:hypothetical protein